MISYVWEKLQTVPPCANSQWPQYTKNKEISQSWYNPDFPQLISIWNPFWGAIPVTPCKGTHFGINALGLTQQV